MALARQPPTPVKFRVFARYLPMRAEAPGVYTVGLYDSLEDTETDILFPLPVLKSNPLLRKQMSLTPRSNTESLHDREPRVATLSHSSTRSGSTRSRSRTWKPG